MIIAPKNIPQLMRDWRKRAGLSLTKAARRLFVAPVTLMKYERGQSTLRVEDLVRIADLYGYDITIKAENRDPLIQELDRAVHGGAQ